MREKALEFATQAHEGQVRKGTDLPYITHPIAVADIALQTESVKKYYSDNFITYDDRYLQGDTFKKAMIDIGKKWTPIIKRIKN